MPAITQRALGFLCFALGSGLAACGGSSSSEDASVPDMSAVDMQEAPDMAPVTPEGYSCENPTKIAGAVGDGTVYQFDTTDGPNGTRDLGLLCGDVDAMRWAPQWVIEYTVPGTGLKAINFSTAINNATSPYFDTVVQVRTTCEMVPTPVVFPPTCFDDADPQRDIRSSGAVTAMGGTKLYFIITGYTDLRYQMTFGKGPLGFGIQARDASLPVATSAVINRFSDRVEVEVTGTDADGDAIGALMLFKNAEGGIVDTNNDGAGNAGDTLAMGFATALTGMTSYTGSIVIDGTTFARLTAGNASTATVTLIDSGYGLSGTVEAATMMYAEATIGEACDASTRCYRPLECTSSICTVPAAIQTACDGASVMTIPTPTTETTSVIVTGNITASAASQFSTTTCGNTSGPEKLVSVTVPDGHYDLLLSTANSGTSNMADTVIYIRQTCAVSASELPMGCGDDISGSDLRSQLEIRNVAPGTYTVFVEPYQAVANGAPSLSFGLNGKLRPVLDTGAECDVAGVLNRCSAGACVAGSPATCP